jgi:hypothetical protein
MRCYFPNKLAALSCAMTIATGAPAQVDTDLCRILEGIKDGTSLIQETNSQWRVASRRSIGEPVQTGFSSAKGTLAQHIMKGQAGLSVKWSRADERGPVKCVGYNGIMVVVDMRTVSITTASTTALDVNEPELEELILRRISGRANRDDLLRLREYYIQAGDLNQAKQILDQITQPFLPN